MIKNRIKIIAEIGVNHNGNINTAKKLILVSKKIGADYVKFQTFKTESMCAVNAPLVSYQRTSKKFRTQFELLKSLELSKTQHKILISFCRRVGIKFLSTPFDIDSCDLLENLSLTTIKISSGDITNYPLLEKIGKFAKKVILSSGMSTFRDILQALKVLTKNGLPLKNIVVMHCTSNYPTLPKNVNILAIEYLKKKLKNPIGYSDHTIGNEASLAAVSLGATFIEKHITLNKNFIGPDHKTSLNPEEFSYFVTSIRKLEEMLGKKKNLFPHQKSV